MFSVLYFTHDKYIMDLLPWYYCTVRFSYGYILSHLYVWEELDSSCIIGYISPYFELVGIKFTFKMIAINFLKCLAQPYVLQTYGKPLI